MIRIKTVLLLMLAALSLSAFAAPRENAAAPAVRPLTVAAEAEMARYSLKAYGNRDATNVVKGLLFTPKPVGMKNLDLPH